jgi:hypothetical protein|tara:strand:+ start:2019 stop:2339 length:321 start_codon:yes stop_codon:yes gene_type:complete
MSRYALTPIMSDPDQIPSSRYETTKYPEIPRSFEDIYVFTTQKDRYDIMANKYYNDDSLWWIISSANPSYIQDSIIPDIGIQLRIPSPNRVPAILEEYESLNNNNL